MSGDQEKGQRRTGPWTRALQRVSLCTPRAETTAWRKAEPRRGFRETKGVDSKALHTR